MKLSRIADALGVRCPSGFDDLEIERIRSLTSAGTTDVAFCVSDAHLEEAARSAAGAVIVARGKSAGDKPVIAVEDPYLAYARVAQLFEDCSPPFGEGIHSTAWIDSSASVDPTVTVGPRSVVGPEVTIGSGTVVGAGCVIERGAVIGIGCRIDSGAVIRRDCQLGDRVIIQSQTVVGSEGFGNAREGSRYVRIPCFGSVEIGDDVEIGAGVTIDRGNFEPTVICRGARIDNLVHIAHNVRIGEDAVVVAQVGISGSTTIGDRAILAGQAGFVGHIRIGNDAFVGAKAGVSKSVPDGGKVTGYPARDFMTMRRIEAAQLELPDLLKKVKKIEKRIDQMDQPSTGEQ